MSAEKIIVEGRAVLSVPPSVFYSEHQELQRDMSIAVLRVLRRVKADGGHGLTPTTEQQQATTTAVVASQGIANNSRDVATGFCTGEKEGTAAQPMLLRVCDTLAGAGVRAIRYALEAGPVQVTANDKSKDACEAICRSARLSGIDLVEATPTGKHSGTTPPRNIDDGEAPVPPMRKQRLHDNGHGEAVATEHQVATEPSRIEPMEVAAAAAAAAPAPSPKASSPALEDHRSSFTVTSGDANALLRSGPSGVRALAATERGVDNGDGGCDGASTAFWDFVDVDPFGSCLPFLDAAVGAIVDHGVLAAASTDLAVLCGRNGSQTCRRQYCASVASTAYAKEGAMRVLLHRLDLLARRRRKRVVPLLCVALDFYVRLFVMIVPEDEDEPAKDHAAAEATPAPEPTPAVPAVPSASASATPLMVLQRLGSPEFSVIDAEAGSAPTAPTTLPESGNTAYDNNNNNNNDKAEVTPQPQKPETDCSTAASREGDGNNAGCVPPTVERKGCLTLGPFWRGPLFHPLFLAAVLDEVKRSGAGDDDDNAAATETSSRPLVLDTRRQLLFLLEALGGELRDCPFLYSLKEVAAGVGRGVSGRGKERLPSVEVVRASVRSAGHDCSGSHTEPLAIKTRAPLAVIEAAVRDASTAKVHHDQQQQCHTQQGNVGSLHEVRARVLRQQLAATAASGTQQNQQQQQQQQQQDGEVSCSSGSGSPGEEGRDGGVNGSFFEAGPRVPVGRGRLHSVESLKAESEEEEEESASVFKREDESAERTIASLEEFIEREEESSALITDPSCNNNSKTEAVEKRETGTDAKKRRYLSSIGEPQDGSGVDHCSSEEGHEDDASAFPPAGGRVSIFVVSESPVGVGGGGRYGIQAEEQKYTEACERLLSARWSGRVRFLNSLAEACSMALETPEGGGLGVTVVLLGGSHCCAGAGGIRLSRRNMTIVGVRGWDGLLPIVEGGPYSHAITCTADNVSIRSIRLCAGASASSSSLSSSSSPSSSSSSLSSSSTSSSSPSSSSSSPSSSSTSSSTPSSSSSVSASTPAGVSTPSIPPPIGSVLQGVADTATTTTRTTTVAGKGGGDGGGRVGRAAEATKRKRPRLVFDREAAQAVLVASNKAAAASRENRFYGARKKLRTTSRNPGGGVPPVHAITIEAGSASIVGCEVSSFLPCACVCVSGAGTRVSLQETRLFDGRGMGLLVCGRAEACAAGCSFKGMAAAGVEGRGGSQLQLSNCLVSGCGRSGVFIQTFSKGFINNCDVLGNSHAGVETMRNASLSMDACAVGNNRRGGVLVHCASTAALRDCTVSGNCMAGIDVRTGAEATLEACLVRDGRTSGIYVSTGGGVKMSSTLVRSNRLAAVEVNDQPLPTTTTARTAEEVVMPEETAARWGSSAGVRDGVMAGGDVGSGCRFVLSGSHNAMVGNGSDTVMRTGAIAVRVPL